MVTFGNVQMNEEFTEIIISIDKFEDEEESAATDSGKKRFYS